MPDAMPDDRHNQRITCVTDRKSENRSSAIAAAIILIGAGTVIYLLPDIVLWLGNFSPWLATAVGFCIILCFFLIFWLRARYQRRHHP
jgi:Ca2+/Na+ antiporter